MIGLQPRKTIEPIAGLGVIGVFGVKPPQLQEMENANHD
jgi:hypothetical protein